MKRLQTALDAAAMAAALVRESVRLMIGRLVSSRGEGPVPASAAALGPAELTAAMSQACRGARVARVRVLDGHSGTTERARLALEYETVGEAGERPASVFVKTAPASLAGQLFVNLMDLAATEVRFYREIAPTLPIAVPRAWYAERHAATGAFVLVLEDLAARGARFTDVSDRADLETARRVVTTLGRLHAAFWNSPRFDADLHWLRPPGPRPSLRLERFLCRALVGRGTRRFADVIPEQIRASTTRIVAARDRLERAWAEGPTTLLHGDSHIGNMYFVGDTVGLLDWQVAQRGQGMRDVSYFLVNSVPTEIRRAHERDLIELWRAVLEEGGVCPPAFDTAWRQHRLHATYTWIGSAVTAAAPQLQPAPIARAGLSRACRALVDLDSLAALDEIGA
ncbi:MAG: phosphotransferase [Candidatus Binatia bacterium]